VVNLASCGTESVVELGLTRYQLPRSSSRRRPSVPAHSPSSFVKDLLESQGARQKDIQYSEYNICIPAVFVPALVLVGVLRHWERTGSL
jgi:hypothetical protein